MTDKSILMETLKYHDIDLNDVILQNCNHSQIHNYIKDFDLSVFFIKKCFSKIASCPTKFAESLALGVPVITGTQIGDVDEIFLSTNNNIGYLIDDFSESEIKKSIKHVLNLKTNIKTSQNCYDTAKKYFDLNYALSIYNSLYNFKK